MYLKVRDKIMNLDKFTHMRIHHGDVKDGEEYLSLLGYYDRQEELEMVLFSGWEDDFYNKYERMTDLMAAGAPLIEIE